jgi:hypothetical protein
MTAVDPSTLSWEDLKEHIYFEDGSWRDIYVLDATRDDWQKWADYVNATYRVCFFQQDLDEGTDRMDLNEALNYWDSNGEGLSPNVTFYVSSIAVKCHF